MFKTKNMKIYIKENLKNLHMKTSKKRKRIKVITNTLTGNKKPTFENNKFQSLENDFINFFRSQSQTINI